MSSLKSIFTLVAIAVGLSFTSPVFAKDAGKKLVESVAKPVRISAQFAEGLVPFSPEHAAKAMLQVQNEATKATNAAGDNAALKQCGQQLGAKSKQAQNAAKAGQGAFKAAYADVISVLRACQKLK